MMHSTLNSDVGGRYGEISRAVSLILVLVATGQLREAQASPSSNAPKTNAVVLQLHYTHQFQFAGYYAAAEKGYYRQEGLNVAIKEGNRDRTSTDLVLTGKANFGTVGSGLLYERLHDKPLVVLAAIFQHSAYALMARRDSGIVSAKDLIGRRITVQLNARDAELHALFRREGIDEKKLKLVRSEWNYADLIDGKVDAAATYITTGPQQLQARGVAVTLIRPLGYGLDFYGDCLFTSERELAANPMRVELFRRASLRGWSYAMDHPEEVIEMILNRYGGKARGLTRESLRLEAEAMRSLILPDLVEIGHMNAARWRRLAATYHELGMVDHNASLQGFLYDQDPSPDWRWAYWTGSAIVTVGLAAGLIVCWNARLRQKVKEHTSAQKLRNDELRREIADRVRAETTLRQSEQRFRDLFVTSPDAIFVEDLDGTVLDVNAAACELHAMNRTELLGKNVQELVPAHWREQVKRVFPLLVSGEMDCVDGFSLRPSGESIPVEIRASRIEFDGRAALLLHVRDITERTRASETLRTALQFNEQIISSAGEGIVVCDREFHCVVWNPFMEKLTGLLATQALGKCMFDLLPCMKEQGIDEQIKRTLAGERTSSGDFQFTIPSTGRSGWAVCTHEPQRSTKGEIIGVVAVVTDITEHKRLEDQLRQSQKMDAIGQFGGGIAHDFNNLMAAVIGFSELSLARLDSHPAARFIGETKKAAERAAALTRQILAFSRKQVLEPKVLNLNTVVDNLGEMLRRLIPEDIELRIVPSPSIGSVKADLSQLDQVIINLTLNARDAMPDGGTLTITTDEAILDTDYARRTQGLPPGLYVMLDISDTGVGMSEEVKAHLFEPFFTTKPRGKGTGLGLAMCYGIVQQSGGHIDVESEPGKGTTIHVYLPRVAEKPSEPAPLEKAKPLQRGNETVLLVEDEPALRELNSLVLHEEGYTVLEASNGVDAMRLANSHEGKIHLLLTDVIMPQMGGAELARQIRSRYPEAKVLFTSGYAEDAIGRHGVLDPGTAFLSKPFLSSALTVKVREVLDHGQNGHHDGNGMHGHLVV